MKGIPQFKLPQLHILTFYYKNQLGRFGFRNWDIIDEGNMMWQSPNSDMIFISYGPKPDAITKIRLISHIAQSDNFDQES